MQIAITGGCGYLGTALSHLLLKQGHSVLSIHRSPTHFMEERHRCLSIEENPNYLIDESNIRSDVLILLESNEISMRYTEKNQSKGQEFQKDAFFHKLLQYSASKILYASSAGALYGDPSHRVPMNESSLIHPLSDYGSEKLKIETSLEEFGRENKQTQVTSLRIANIYGEVKEIVTPLSIIPTLVNNILQNRITSVYGPDVVRDYVHVWDVAKLFALAVNLDCRLGVLNVGTGVGTSTSQVIDLISDKMKQKAKLTFMEKNQLTPSYNVVDSSLAEHIFGWVPEVSLSRGLDEVIGQYTVRSRA